MARRFGLDRPLNIPMIGKLPNKRLKWSKPLKKRSELGSLFDTEFRVAFDGGAIYWKLRYPNMDRPIKWGPPKQLDSQ